MLEPEATYGANQANGLEGTIRNGDGDFEDTMLHVFRVDGTSVVDVMGSQELAVDAGLLVNGRSLAISNGQVFFRAPEQGGIGETTIRISEPPGGGDADNLSLLDSYAPAVSRDGRFIAFQSLATNLPGGNGFRQVFVHDRDVDENGVFDEAGQTANEVVSRTTGGTTGDNHSYHAAISPTGRYVVFASGAPNLVPGQVFPCLANTVNSTPGGSCAGIVLHDRDNDTTELISIDATVPGGPNGEVLAPSVSEDGRFVTFWSVANNLLPAGQDANTCGGWTLAGTCPDIFVYDRCIADDVVVCGNPHAEIVSRFPGGAQTAQRSDLPVMTPDGRFVMFTSQENLLGIPNHTGHDTAFVVDRIAGTIEAASVSSTGQYADTLGGGVLMSADARYIAFETSAALVPGTLGISGFVRDRVTNAIDVSNLGSDGSNSNGQNGPFAISEDGRFVLLGGNAWDLVADDTNVCRPGDVVGQCPDVFVHDRLTGVTKRVSVPATGGDGNNESLWASISGDGRTVAFSSVASNLVPGDGNNTCAPINGSTNCGDVFIRTIDWSLPDTKDQTGDHDLDDTILEVLDSNATPGTVPTPLCPAGAAAITDGRVAFLRPEPAGDTTLAKLPLCPAAGAFVGLDPDLNADGDAGDDVVHLWRGGPNLVDNLKCAASAVALSATHVAAVVTEAGTTQVKGLALSAVPPANCNAWTPSNQAAESVTFCGDLVAFLTPERLQNTNLNAGTTTDADLDDAVLQVFNPGTGAVMNTGHAAVDFVCNANQIAFRTREADDGPGFAGNGDADDLDDVLQVYDLTRPECRTGGQPADCVINTADSIRPCLLEACDPRLPYRVLTDTVKFLTFECDEGAGGIESLPRCPAPGGTNINNDTPPDASDLVIQVFNVRTRTTTPIGTVISDNNDIPLAEQNPLGDGETEDSDDGSTVYVTQGRCLEIGAGCVTTATCPSGTFCDGIEDKCIRDQGTCTVPTDCPVGSTCTDRPIVPASPDTDADGIPDHLDNCRTVANAEQTDDDDDAVGNACDAFCTGINDAKDSIKLKTKNGAGQLTAKLTIALADYAGEPVTVRLDDTDSSPIASEMLATVPPKGSRGNLWQYKVKTDGLQSVQLKSLAPRNPGRFQVKIKSKRWFSTDDANRPAEETTLTVLIGSSCYSQEAKKKTD
jgi:Tol biopolymer transport system component